MSILPLLVLADEIYIGSSKIILSTINKTSPAGAVTIYETIIFEEGVYKDLYIQRYSSYEDALLGHVELNGKLKDVSEEIKASGLSPEDWHKQKLSPRKTKVSS